MKYSDWFIDPVHDDWPNEELKEHCEKLYAEGGRIGKKWGFLFGEAVIHTDKFGKLHCINYDRPYDTNIPILTDEHLENIKNYVLVRLKATKYFNIYQMTKIGTRFNYYKLQDEHDKRF